MHHAPPHGRFARHRVHVLAELHMYFDASRVIADVFRCTLHMKLEVLVHATSKAMRGRRRCWHRNRSCGLCNSCTVSGNSVLAVDVLLNEREAHKHQRVQRRQGSWSAHHACLRAGTESSSSARSSFMRLAEGEHRRISDYSPSA